ncbi:hypothetical protein ACPCXA_25265, partial [Lysinibacillus agricola]
MSDWSSDVCFSELDRRAEVTDRTVEMMDRRAEVTDRDRKSVGEGKRVRSQTPTSMATISFTK